MPLMQAEGASTSTSAALSSSLRGGAAVASSSTGSASARASSGCAAVSPRRTTVVLDAAVYDKQRLWKQHGARKLEHRAQQLMNQEEQECTFAPRINRPRKVRAATLALAPGASFAFSSDDSDCSSQYTSTPVAAKSVDAPDLRHEEEEEEPQPIHPTESKQSSILLHLARQERAREEAQKAQHKLRSTQPVKDFTKVTTAQPFDLSVTNRRPRASSASPTSRAACTPRGRTVTPGSSRGGGASAAVPTKQSTKRRPLAAVGGGRAVSEPTGESGAVQTCADVTGGCEHSVAVSAAEAAWQQERATLMSVIETQRRELEQREQAQSAAARLAATFSTAIQTFEERLEIVEKTTQSELSEMRQLLAKQTAATELIVHALGLGPALRSPPSPPAAPTSTTAVRKETK